MINISALIYNELYSGESRPSATGMGEGGAFEGLTMNVEFYEDNSGSAQKMRYFRKIKGAGGPPGPSPGSATALRKAISNSVFF